MYGKEETLTLAKQLAEETGRNVYVIDQGNGKYDCFRSESVKVVTSGDTDTHKPKSALDPIYHEEVFHDKQVVFDKALVLATSSGKTQYVVTSPNGASAVIRDEGSVMPVHPQGKEPVCQPNVFEGDAPQASTPMPAVRPPLRIAVPLFDDKEFSECHYAVKALLKDRDVVYSAMHAKGRKWAIFVDRRPRLEDGFVTITTHCSKTNVATIERAQDIPKVEMPIEKECDFAGCSASAPVPVADFPAVELPPEVRDVEDIRRILDVTDVEALVGMCKELTAALIAEQGMPHHQNVQHEASLTLYKGARYRRVQSGDQIITTVEPPCDPVTGGQIKT